LRFEVFIYPAFDIDIVRKVDARRLAWPEFDEADDERSLGGNRDYSDLRGLSWSEAQRILNYETDLILRIEDAEDAEQEMDQIGDELYEEDVGLYGLDLGVASSVVGLSAAKCVPFASCNGGSFGGHHHERYPLVAFFAQLSAVTSLIACAEAAGVGLEGNESGGLVVYADDIRKMRQFALELLHRRSQF
jgi:hypothetical protein